ncbi:MAG: DUF5985 family protein [Phycisphaerales bacterium]
MAEAVYILCAITSLLCAVLLFRAYRRAPSRLLLWSSVCFVALALNSILVIVDRIIVPTAYDFRIHRLGVAAAGLVALLWALITDTPGKERP